MDRLYFKRSVKEHIKTPPISTISDELQILFEGAVLTHSFHVDYADGIILGINENATEDGHHYLKLNFTWHGFT